MKPVPIIAIFRRCLGMLFTVTGETTTGRVEAR
jgi:hypothetical protein